MNFPSVNFKLKPEISRSLTGAALLLSAAALINAGESKAALFDCFLNNLSACGGLLGDKDFTNFSFTGFTPRSGDKLSIYEQDGVWTVETDFTPNLTGPASGTLNYNVAIVGTSATFNEARVNVLGSNAVTRPSVNSTITSISPFVTTTAAPVAKSFANGITSISVSQAFTVVSSRTLNSWTTEFTQNVPGPLPLLGAAAAFGFSRRLRSRIKTSAAA